MGHPTNPQVGRNGQVQFAFIAVLAMPAVLRFGSGAGVPVYGPSPVLPTRMASDKALPAEDAADHSSQHGTSEKPHVSPTAIASVGTDSSHSDSQSSAQPAEFVETKQAEPPSETPQPGLASATKAVPHDGLWPEATALGSFSEKSFKT